MSAVLGMPPPEIKADGIEQSLTTDQMRNQFFLTVIWITIPALPTVALCGGGTSGVIRNRNHGLQSARIKTATGLVTRIAIRIAMGNVTGPGRGTSDMVQTDPADALHDAETMTMSAAVPTSADVRMGMTVVSTTAKQSNGMGPVPACCVAAGGRTLLNVDLCCLHPCCIQHL